MLAQSGGDEPQDKVGDSGEVREALLYWITPLLLLLLLLQFVELLFCFLF